MQKFTSLLFSLLISSIIFSHEIGNNKRNSSQPASNVYEKVYLHTDRNSYISGEDIWFKAYLVDAHSNQLTNRSNNLYVELISNKNQIVQKRTIHLQDGVGNGSFHFKDSISAGHYLIRAYTNWIRNFGNDFYYEKDIIIADSRINDSISQKQNQFSNNSIDIQFFPEGGSLVDEVSTLVAFKAINTIGLGCFVSGHIVSTREDTISAFESTHLGMGKFRFRPSKNITYYAVGKTKSGQKFNVQLPKIHITGIAMEVNSEDSNHLLITVKTNKETLPIIINNDITLRGSFKNSLCISASFEMNSLIHKFQISTKYFPEGITRLTIVDDMNKALCERLVYINNNPDLIVSVSPNQKKYLPRTPVSLNISVADDMGKAMASNLSLSVYDKNANYDADPYPSDIASYFLLESDIRGNIEDAGSYFDPSNPQRKKNMELLLLTQAWRDFKWKYNPDSANQINFPAENGLKISGKLKRLFAKKPIINADISLAIYNDSLIPFFFLTQTDSSGNYIFDSLNYSGENTIILSAINVKGKKRGELFLDTFAHTPPIDYKPQIHNIFSENYTELKESAIIIDSINERYKLDNIIMLDEISIKANRAEKKIDDGHLRNYPKADISIKITDKNNTAHYNIFEFLSGKIPGLEILHTPNGSYIIKIRGAASFYMTSEPLYLIDGIPTDQFEIAGLSLLQIDKVEVLKTPGTTAFFGSRGANGVISILTKKGEMHSNVKPIFYSINTKVNGYDVPRTFYKPRYDIPNVKNKKYDIRSTIHWEPNIDTNNQSNKIVKFWNADKVTTIEIKLEGISETGIPITYKTHYKVEW